MPKFSSIKDFWKKPLKRKDFSITEGFFTVGNLGFFVRRNDQDKQIKKVGSEYIKITLSWVINAVSMVPDIGVPEHDW